MQQIQSCIAKRFVSFLLCFAIVLSLFSYKPPKASAVVIDGAMVVGGLVGWLLGATMQKEFGHYWQGNTFWQQLLKPRPEDGCKHFWKVDVDGYQYCKKCDMPFSLYYEEREQEYLNSLDSTTASSGIVATGFSCSVLSGSIDGPLPFCLNYLAKSSVDNLGELLISLGLQDKVMIVGVYYKGSSIYGLYWDNYGRLTCGWFSNPLGVASSDVFGVYSFDDLTLNNSAYPDLIAEDGTRYESHLFLNEALASAYSSTDSAFALDEASTFSYDSTFRIGVSQRLSGNSVFTQRCTVNFTNNGGYWGSTPPSYIYYCPDSDYVTWDNSRIIVQPSGTDSSSRGDDLMEMISDYNKTNSYLNSPTAVNYYIGTVNADGSVDKFFEPGVFDEQTMIFTEPESGTEYQASSWEYDYTTRTYGIAFDDGVFSIDGQAANIVLYTLGDDACVLSYYNGETLVKQVSYNYLMVSQSVCNINGHTNTVETTKEATCTAPGERLTTCSVCGHQTVEELPQLEHTYSDYTVQKEATCTNNGMAANTCLTCGQEVTELLPALGHDWLPTSITDESWAMPENVSCPDCHGTVFSYEYQDYEVLLGKNLFNPESTLYISDDESVKVYPPKYENGIFYSGARSGHDAGFELCIPVVPGETYTLTYELACGTPINGGVYVYPDRDANGISIGRYCLFTSFPKALPSPYTFTVPQGFYYIGLSIAFGDSRYEVGIKNVQLERGSVATEYEPYDPDYVEIVPPLYHFTCSDCSAKWTAEAIYQHAYTTFTCSRCDETMIQSEDPDAGLFGSIGNFFADGIIWITNKLSQFMDSLSGINDAFRDYMEEIKGSGGQFPAFLAAFVAVMPEDLMVALWFCLIAVVALLVWKKWFS